MWSILSKNHQANTYRCYPDSKQQRQSHLYTQSRSQSDSSEGSTTARLERAEAPARKGSSCAVYDRERARCVLPSNTLYCLKDVDKPSLASCGLQAYTHPSILRYEYQIHRAGQGDDIRNHTIFYITQFGVFSQIYLIVRSHNLVVCQNSMYSTIGDALNTEQGLSGFPVQWAVL